MRFPREDRPSAKDKYVFVVGNSFTQKMGKSRKVALTVFGFGLAISSIVCVLLDLFMSVTNPEPGHVMNLMGIDQSLINQSIYVSVGATVTISVGSILNLVALIAPKMPRWVSNKNNATFVVSLATTVFIVYLATLVGSRDNIDGFDTAYKIVKSSIEHFLNPVILIVLYFTCIVEQTNTKEYARKQAGGILLFFTVYVTYLVVREEMLLKYGDQLDNGNKQKPDGGRVKPYNLFPYIALDPLDQPGGRNYRGVPALIAIEFIPYGLEILFSYLNNLSSKSLLKKFPRI